MMENYPCKNIWQQLKQIAKVSQGQPGSGSLKIAVCTCLTLRRVPKSERETVHTELGEASKLNLIIKTLKEEKDNIKLMTLTFVST